MRRPPDSPPQLEIYLFPKNNRKPAKGVKRESGRVRFGFWLHRVETKREGGRRIGCADTGLQQSGARKREEAGGGPWQALAVGLG